MFELAFQVRAPRYSKALSIAKLFPCSTLCFSFKDLWNQGRHWDRCKVLVGASMGKVQTATYRDPPTPGGLEKMEKGELQWFDIEMYGNLNTGILEQYLDEKNNGVNASLELREGDGKYCILYLGRIANTTSENKRNKIITLIESMENDAGIKKLFEEQESVRRIAREAESAFNKKLAKLVKNVKYRVGGL